MKKIALKYPAPDTEAYSRKMAEGFAAFPQRHLNYQRFQKAPRVRHPQHMPIKIDIEHVSRCNLRCRMCQMTEYPGRRRAVDMTWEQFRDTVDALPGIVEMKLQGIGEPFLNKDFVKMVRYASMERKIWVRSTTNAMLLGSNDNYKAIIDAGIGELQISIDGTTKETFERIRVNSDFGKISDNCKLINNYCREKGDDKTRMWVLLQKDNIEELDRFPEFARYLGFNRLTISMDIVSWRHQSFEKNNSGKEVSHMIDQERIDHLLSLADTLGVDLSFWDNTSKFTVRNCCPWPFERAFISSDRKVVPCCMISNPDIFNFGELGDFEKIWHSEAYNLFREDLLSGNIPEICRSCYAA